MQSTSRIVRTRSIPSLRAIPRSAISSQRAQSPLRNHQHQQLSRGQRPFTHTAIMSNDEDYMSFLNTANQDTGSTQATSQSSSGGVFKAIDQGAEVPKPIQTAIKDAFYVTDADEPFEGVSLKWDAKDPQDLPDEASFAKLINHPEPNDASIEIMDPADWDRQGQYKSIIDAVSEASKGADVRVYRVERDGSRVEYWVVSNKGGEIVGAKALAVES